jgi:hypothetical protein
MLTASTMSAAVLSSTGSRVGAVSVNPQAEVAARAATRGDTPPQCLHALRGRWRGRADPRTLPFGDSLGVICEGLRHGGVLGLQASALPPSGGVHDVSDGPRPMSRPPNCSGADRVRMRSRSPSVRPRHAALPKLPSN